MRLSSGQGLVELVDDVLIFDRPVDITAMAPAKAGQ